MLYLVVRFSAESRLVYTSGVKSPAKQPKQSIIYLWMVLTRLVEFFELIPLFIQVRVFRNQNVLLCKLNTVKTINVGIQNPNIAVIALYPENSVTYIDSLINLIEGLQEHEISPLIVSNRKIPVEILRMLLSRNLTIIERSNVGRDFGAYKCGILWILKNHNLDRIKSLLCVNDTLSWPTSSSNVVEQLKSFRWGGIFLNLADKTHINSFCMWFSHEVIQEIAFQNFWRNYLPSNFKHYAVHKGEIALSTTLIQNGFRPEVIVNSDFVLSSLKSSSRKMLSNLFMISDVSISPSTSPHFPSPHFLIEANIVKEFEQINTENLRKIVADFMLRNLYLDTPHSLGLHLYLLHSFPIKRDLYKYYSLADVYNALSVNSIDYASEVVSEFENLMTVRMLGVYSSKIKRFIGEL